MSTSLSKNLPLLPLLTSAYIAVAGGGSSGRSGRFSGASDAYANTEKRVIEMNKAEAEIIKNEAELVVRENCSRLIKTLSEFGYSGVQCDAFVQIASSHLLGGSLDLWLEVHGGDTDTLARFVCARIDAKKKRDAAEKRRKSH